MSQLLSTTVTLLFTDVERSTQLLRQLGPRYATVLAEHQQLLRGIFAEHDGRVIDTQGDSFFVVFSRAHDAVAAAVAVQRALAERRWPDGVEVRVRIGIHTGEPEPRDGRYVGLDVHRAARIAASAHGGQIVLSSVVRDLVESDLPVDEDLLDLGEQRLKDLVRPEHLFQLVVRDLPQDFPPLMTLDAEAAAARSRRRRRIGLAAAIVGAIAIVAVPLTVFLAGDGGGTPEPIVGHAVAKLDASTGRLERAVSVGSAPGELASAGDAVWYAGPASGEAVRVEVGSGMVTQTTKIGGDAGGIAIGEDAAWLVSKTEGTVSRVDLATGRVAQLVPVGAGPTGVAVGAGSVWVTSPDDRSLTRIDAGSGRKVATIRTGAAGRSIAYGFGAVWVGDELGGTVSKIDPGTNSVVAKVNVGNGPRAIAVGAGSVWVVNGLDGTVSRIDPRGASVQATTSVGPGPGGVAAGPDGIWVAGESTGTVSRIDPRTNDVTLTRRIGGAPQGIAVAGDAVFVTVRAAAGHRGGTLRVHLAKGSVDSIDPARAYTSFAIQLLGLSGDGLVAFKRVGGPDGSSLVPDLALSIPAPTEGGKTYVFRLRSGVRFSTGRPVRASDVRASIERIFEARSPRLDLYSGIVGGNACARRPQQCDLSRGIVTDDAEGTVTFHLSEPDPEFLYKLALWFAYVLPAGTRVDASGTRPVPATGPYVVGRYTPDSRLVLVRNPRFRSWSQAARPGAYPDRIDVRFVEMSKAGLARERDAVVAGTLDLPAGVPDGTHDALRQRYASQVHELRLPITVFLVLDTKRPPFDNADARRAVAYAVDRAAFARGLVAEPTCQVLPPGFPGYEPYCPYTKSPGTATWSAPDLAAARRLVARSGTSGARVLVSTPVHGIDRTWANVALANLRAIGFRASLRVLPDTAYYQELQAVPSRVQVGTLGWIADYPAPSGFLATLFGCDAFGTFVCDPSVDREVERALEAQVQDPASAAALWARLDRQIVDAALWVPLVNTRGFFFVSERFGNFQHHPVFGVLLDQAWVR